MLLRALLIAAAHLGPAMLPGIAEATPAYTIDAGARLRAGPGVHHAVTARIPGGEEVNVLGCLRDHSWCNAEVGSKQGWISSSRLEFAHAGTRVPLRAFSTFFNAPTIDYGMRGRDDRRRPEPLDQGPVECEACPWPSGRREGSAEAR